MLNMFNTFLKYSKLTSNFKYLRNLRLPNPYPYSSQRKHIIMTFVQYLTITYWKDFICKQFFLIFMRLITLLSKVILLPSERVRGGTYSPFSLGLLFLSYFPSFCCAERVKSIEQQNKATNSSSTSYDILQHILLSNMLKKF